MLTTQGCLPRLHRGAPSMVAALLLKGSSPEASRCRLRSTRGDSVDRPSGDIWRQPPLPKFSFYIQYDTLSKAAVVLTMTATCSTNYLVATLMRILFIARYFLPSLQKGATSFPTRKVESSIDFMLLPETDSKPAKLHIAGRSRASRPIKTTRPQAGRTSRDENGSSIDKMRSEE